ncbi:MAG: hypothetical protein K8T20_03800 [Planctomycetes bacterium]|nr:hypothetical protein [Planctomycetota bacterium]
MKPLRLLLLALLASAAAADPPPRTPEDDLRDALAHEPFDVKFEQSLAEVAAFLQETLQEIWLEEK